ncbi:MAG: ShlB/FhaC/HecB family hemolysin secretion/activation protein [Cyanobacteria bacterium P01_G01_bin.19]
MRLKGYLSKEKHLFEWFTALDLKLIAIAVLVFFPLKVLAQSETDIRENAPNVIERTAPRQNRPLTPKIPQPKPEPNLQAPNIPRTSECLQPNDRRDAGEIFYVRDVEVLGNTVLQSEIDAEINRFKRHFVTLEDLVCLRSQITNLYLNNGYVTSGAFIPNNQDLDDGIVAIQVIEGSVAEIGIRGLKRLRSSYIRSRVSSATKKPLNQVKLESALQLLLQNPLISRVDAELTASNTAGSNILLLDIQEDDAFFTNIGTDNYRSSSIGESQLTASINHNNLLGFGDRIYASYSLTEGLDLYSLGYTFPINAKGGTFSFAYDNSDTEVVDDEFANVDIASQTESFSVGIRQPAIQSPNTEFALSLNLDVRRRQTFLDSDPFPFTLGLTDGFANVTVLRFAQEWVNRQPTRVFAARSQFNFGINAFDATINNIGADGEFLAWQGQFQWVQQLSSRILLVTRLGTQLTLDSLLSLEKFSLGGINTIRGYAENRLVTDNGAFTSVELRIPVTSNPQTFQLIPFAEVGTGWNNEEPGADPTTLASLGLGLRWSITSNLSTRLDYGIPLLETTDEGDGLQDKGLHWFLNYRLF